MAAGDFEPLVVERTVAPPVGIIVVKHWPRKLLFSADVVIWMQLRKVDMVGSDKLYIEADNAHALYRIIGFRSSELLYELELIGES